MSYYTYENWRAEGRKGTVHAGECGFCNQGKGLSGGARSNNGKWHGPFDSVASAKGAVQGVTPKVHRCAASL
jgi:hypothetical protein